MAELVVCSGSKLCGDPGCIHSVPHKKQMMGDDIDYTCAFPEMDQAWCNTAWNWCTCQPDIKSKDTTKEAENV